MFESPISTATATNSASTTYDLITFITLCFALNASSDDVLHNFILPICNRNRRFFIVRLLAKTLDALKTVCRQRGKNYRVVISVLKPDGSNALFITLSNTMCVLVFVVSAPDIGELSSYKSTDFI
jgi:hypothetical protein